VIKAVFSVSHDPSEIRLSILKTVVMVNFFFLWKLRFITSWKFGL